MHNYIAVSTTNYCGHVNGGYPARCSSSLGNCRAKCDSFEWCKAYSSGGPTHCALMTSAASCPVGWDFNGGSRVLSVDQITVSSTGGYNCFSKTGKILYVQDNAENLFRFNLYLIIYFIIYLSAEKLFGVWVNDGACQATGADPTCGPGIQIQNRTCIDGTTDKCTAKDISQTISCSSAGTALPDCPIGIYQ